MLFDLLRFLINLLHPNAFMDTFNFHTPILTTLRLLVPQFPQPTHCCLFTAGLVSSH